MSTVITSISPIWKVLIVGLILGAGLPALFAFGLRSASGTVSPDGTVTAPNAAGRLIGGICFLIIALVVVAAIVVLAATKPFLARFGLS